MIKNLVIILILSLIACSSTKKVYISQYSTPLPESAEVNVIGPGQIVPKGSAYKGHLKIGDSGFTVNCSYDLVITAAQKQARSMGGNLIFITKHKTPSILSTCHRIEGDVYFESY